MAFTQDQLNEHLAHNYGYELNGLPRFRIAFSDSELDTSGTPKYFYIKSRWLLEKYFPEFDEYCAVWTFSIKGEYVYPEKEWLDILCQMILAPKKIPSKKQLDDMEREEFEKDMRELEAMLGDTDGVHEMKNQEVNFVKPVFLNLDNLNLKKR